MTDKIGAVRTELPFRAFRLPLVEGSRVWAAADVDLAAVDVHTGRVLEHATADPIDPAGARSDGACLRAGTRWIGAQSGVQWGDIAVCVVREERRSRLRIDDGVSARHLELPEFSYAHNPVVLGNELTLTGIEWDTTRECDEFIRAGAIGPIDLLGNTHAVVANLVTGQVSSRRLAHGSQTLVPRVAFGRVWMEWHAPQSGKGPVVTRYVSTDPDHSEQFAVDGRVHRVAGCDAGLVAAVQRKQRDDYRWAAQVRALPDGAHSLEIPLPGHHNLMRCPLFAGNGRFLVYENGSVHVLELTPDGFAHATVALHGNVTNLTICENRVCAVIAHARSARIMTFELPRARPGSRVFELV